MDVGAWSESEGTLQTGTGDFGRAVALAGNFEVAHFGQSTTSNDIAVIGAPEADKVFVYRFSDGEMEEPLTASEPQSGERTSRKPVRKTAQRRLSYNQKRELAGLPEHIEALEQEQRVLESKLSEADFYRGDKTTIRETLQRLEQLNAALHEAYERWAYLDGMDA